MPAQKVFDFATDALRRCSPQFQVISLITIFLSVLVSTVYVIYLALYAPLERVVMLLALGYAGWQMHHAPSIHQPPTAPLAPESFVSLNDQYEPVLPAYTPKSTNSPYSDDSDDSDAYDAYDAYDASLPTVCPPVSLSNPTEGPSPTFPSEPPQLSINAVNVLLPSSTASATVSLPTCRLVTVHDDGTEEYFYYNPCPLTESRQLQHQTVNTTFDSKVLVMPGSSIATRVVKEFDDGSLELEVSCGNTDYRLQLSPSEVLQLYEQSVKRPP
jgi:hypothetical protein